MFKLISAFLFFFFIHEGLGCIPTKPDDGLYITFPATDVCVGPAGTAQLFLANNVELVAGESAGLGKKAAVGQCQINFANGAVKYYDGNTPAEYVTANGNAAIGSWDRTNCPNACTCTAIACYEVRPDPGNAAGPIIYFYPHCNTPSDCFVAVIIFTAGALVNPENPADMFDQASQEADGTSNVNGPTYPKVFRVGCSGCPVLK